MKKSRMKDNKELDNNPRQFVVYTHPLSPIT